MKRPEGDSRICLPALLVGLLIIGASVHADEGVPALLRFAEEYQKKNPVRDLSPTLKPQEPSPPQAEPVKSRTSSSVSHMPVAPERKDVGNRMKALQSRLVKQQSSIAQLEDKLRVLQQTVNTQEQSLTEARQKLKGARMSGNNEHDIHAKSLGRIVQTLRKAFTGSPDEKELRRLVLTSHENEKHLSLQLAESQALTAALKKQLREQQKSHEKNIQEITLKDQASNEMQAIVSELRQKLSDEQRALTTIKEANAKLHEQGRALETALNALKATHAQVEYESQQKDSEITALKEASQSVTSKASSGTSDTPILEKQIQALKKENAELVAFKKGVIATDNEFSVLKLKAEAITSEKALLEEQVEVLRNENAELNLLKYSENALISELAALKEKEKKLYAEKSDLEKQIQLIRNESSEKPIPPKKMITTEALKKESVRRNYAEGSMLGRDILNLLEERTNWGIAIDRNTLLAGIIDTIEGNLRISPGEYQAALVESERLVLSARDKIRKTQQSAGEAFIRDFESQEGVKKSSSGFWYKVDYEGDMPVPEHATVDIVVKESLTDGLVIQDMDLSGKVLSQPINDFPPLFREAIGYLKNHGSITLVVPPELAYGEVGYPPHIPPDATMVYVLRIENITPASENN
ncbi:hypothetical protein BJP35_2277 [Enterobacter sp. J49]|uniref:FKBP-type peptidyl-prolyl cis-trans isomerase N-terminal domain-containing protein n=1 Tax=Enterobacter sp. J49 TaxID=1903627 RepID=UPI000A3BCF89|nr:FKBP-type peptidyl-prolyl cis-trans isomerase N-terminal domain-containing protein [Enterobacter sp. J49]OUC37012.1 hypothetical protein BJP35_2277 [Enterobacter sp. J49]